MMRKLVSFLASPGLIEKCLGMPDNYTIIGAEWKFSNNSLLIYVEGPDFPEVKEGDTIVRVKPSVSQSIDENGAHRFVWDWGLEEKK